MQRFLLSCTICVLSFVSNAQDAVYQQVKEILSATHPTLSTEGKLLAYNIWSLEDEESRQLNAEFDRVYDVYQVAKLRGGEKGLIVVAVSGDGLSASAMTTLNYDGIKKLIPIDGDRLLLDLEKLAGNMVFDSGGNQIYADLPAGKIFEAINKLITR